MTLREDYRYGTQYLEAATQLLQRVRGTHPTAGLLEAADLSWWWRTPRTTDNLGQLFWFDDQGRPEAAVIATSWDDGISLDPIIMPNAASGWVAHVVERGVSHADQARLSSIGFTVDPADVLMSNVLRDLGFTIDDDPDAAVIDAWRNTNGSPTISPLRPDYRLSTRLYTATWPHHMTKRSGPNVETRLRQTPLYRADLDLLVLDRENNVAAYGLFWLDPKTGVGLVEPMRTEDEHQRRGLARHLLTSGISRLAAAGACRVKVCFRQDNLIAERLYLSVGFETNKQTVAFSRPVPARR